MQTARYAAYVRFIDDMRNGHFDAPQRPNREVPVRGSFLRTNQFAVLHNILSVFGVFWIPCVYILYTLPEKVHHPQGLCSLAPGYIVCILRGCNASDLFVTVIGDQMALTRPVFAPYVLIMQAVTMLLQR